MAISSPLFYVDQDLGILSSLPPSSIGKLPHLIHEDDCVEVEISQSSTKYLAPRAYLEKKSLRMSISAISMLIKCLSSFSYEEVMKEAVKSRFTDANLSFLDELDIKKIANKARNKFAQETEGGEQAEAVDGNLALGFDAIPPSKDNLNIKEDLVEARGIVNSEYESLVRL
ncbi:conserved hypothetical protein [Ricinus communis]|uniref:Uncharacterized protein n=1 Tax=Ricinus communis TaxID=3988 RepID=B9SIB5_RICCO|nr:conserved hypothetical protein [Ricinus communis]